MRFTIPRNVKKGQSFMGLELVGWIWMAVTLPICILIGWLVFKITASIIGSIVLGASLIGIFYFLFTVDEKTGNMNLGFLLDIVTWYRSKKIHLFWKGASYDNIHTLLVRVNLQKRERE
ncbi:hypothetical protein [Shimazuella kribbensis]|uniref:hypothetical protein n=1 Tax=Shimazuella kribbensis TaxID=139808 RepID=UPI00041D9C80|nr:hypothetical protein [Shimazuella kribbensis]